MTLGQVCSWLFVQAQPYAVKTAPKTLPEATDAPESEPCHLTSLLQNILL